MISQLHLLADRKPVRAEHSWQHRASDRDQNGAKSDLLIDRPDDVVMLCEMKYTDSPFVIDKRYARTLRERADTFRRITATRKSTLLTFISKQGIAPGPYASELVANAIKCGQLFLE